MIFKLFKTKKNWQHKDVNIRISAVNDELSYNAPDDQNILRSMLNEDDSELVRRAVLLKFNNIDEYLDASVQNSNEQVKSFAINQIKEMLVGKKASSLSLQQKQALLNKLTKLTTINPNVNVLLNYWLEHELEPSIVIKLFEILSEKKNSTQFLLQVFIKKQSQEIQKQLLALQLEELNDTAFLTKLSKKAANDEVFKLVNERLMSLKEHAEKPKRLLKQNQLILSKLLALKDQASYGKYIDNKAELDQQWQTSLPELTCLPEEEQQLLITKYDKITEQLAQIFAPKAEAYQQAKITEQLANEKIKAQKEFNEVITSLNQQITTAVFEGDNNEDELINQNQFLSQLNLLREGINSSVLNFDEQQSFLQKATQLEKKLSQLPEIAESVSNATYLISKISQLSLPQSLTELNDRQQTFYEWLADYKKVDKKAQGVLPQSIIDAQKEISNTWQKGLLPLQKEQRKLFDQTKKKLNDINRLLNNGKYKVCFGLFKGVNQTITLLSTQQQQQLQRDFDNISERMAEISDWENYIATPRKQELLEEIKALVHSPLDDPNSQADKVKHYRKLWNSLGHADETIDKDLNEQFNLACEQAFAPCRLFYAEQEKLRALHLVTRNNIVNEAHELSESLVTTETIDDTFDYKALDGKLNKLQQRWQQAGEVDRQEYQKLFKQFKNTIQPIKKAIKLYHDANVIKKQNLITEAEQQLLSDDIYQAIESVKGLQQQWRQIGFAGSHQESKLWQAFRTVNDQVFAKRDLAKSEQQAELSQLADNFTNTLDQLTLTIKDLDSTYAEKSHFVKTKNQAETLLNQVITNKPVIKSVATKVETFIAQLNTTIENISTEHERESWHNIFTLLEQLVQHDGIITENSIVESPEFQHLPNFWQKRLIDQCSLTTTADTQTRSDKTLALEVFAQVPSPAELAQQRMAVQVSLMQEQMQTSEQIDLQQAFVDWLNLGKLESTDLPLLKRLRIIFTS